MKNLKWLYLLIVFLSAPLPSRAEEINRNILGVIDGSEMKHEFDNHIAKYAETPLNHLGFKLEYVDVTKGLPDDAAMRKYAAVISWFRDNTLKNAADYANWAAKQISKGKKFVILDELGFALDENVKPIPNDVLQAFFRAFLITSTNTSDQTENPLLIEVVKKDPAMVEFERSLQGEADYFLNLTTTDPKAKVFLKLKRKDTGTTSDAVFISSKGAMAIGNYALYQNFINYQTRWRIDPFAFFREALNADFPKPDVTTINGMRMFMSHIDGDGIRSKSRIDNKTSCGDLVFSQILSHYQLPISVSALIGDILTAKGEDKQRLADLFRKIFALPNIEPASHGYAHPLIWKIEKRKMAYFDIDDYMYSPASEIGSSIEYINKYLVPPDKKTDLFFWTGDCMPDYEALKYAHDNGIRNINGGDSRFDKQYPSYTYVAPFFRHVDGLLQNYSPDTNEVIFTNIWTGPFYGFRDVIETFKNTESPIRIRPIDVYYHFYITEYESSLNSIHEVYDWSLKQEITPVFVSDYLKTLEGFLSAKIERIAHSHWVVADNGELRTVRFDGNKNAVDLANSKGVIGFLRYQGSLYVHLDNGKRSEIRLTDAPQALPYIVKANGKVENFRREEGAFKFTLKTMGRAQFAAGGLKANGEYSIGLAGKTVNARADRTGQLVFAEGLPGSKFESLEIAIRAR